MFSGSNSILYVGNEMTKMLQLLLLVTVINFCLKHQRQPNHTVYTTKIIICYDFIFKPTCSVRVCVSDSCKYWQLSVYDLNVSDSVSNRMHPLLRSGRHIESSRLHYILIKTKMKMRKTSFDR